MKKILSFFLTLILLAAFGSVALAKEKIVQLTVPGCSAWNSKARIGSILKKIDGVTKHENKENNLLIITFDDEKTTLKIIVNELKKGNFIVNGEPVYLK